MRFGEYIQRGRYLQRRALDQVFRRVVGVGQRFKIERMKVRSGTITTRFADANSVRTGPSSIFDNFRPAGYSDCKGSRRVFDERTISGHQRRNLAFGRKLVQRDPFRRHRPQE